MKPEFAPNDVIVIDPIRIAKSNDFVVVMIKDSTTFKRLIVDAGEQFLKPLNSDYPTRPINDAKIIGHLREN
jgi:SOS-response transcriptional repressor LexA